MKTGEKVVLGITAVVVGYLLLKPEIPPPPPVGKGTLSINTAPIKGGIWLNGVYQGIAPITLELDPGTYTIAFGDVQGYITPPPYYAVLHAGDIVAVTGTYEPLVSTATLNVDTTPVKGGIYIGSVYQGVAPMTFEVDPGTYAISFGDVEGYITPTPQQATLGAGDTATILGTYESVPTEEVYVCPVCGEEFATFSELFSHLVSQHPDWWGSQ